MNKTFFSRWWMWMIGLLALAPFAFSAEVVRIKFAAGQDEFELSSASAGAQTLTVSAANSEVQWIDASVSQKFSRGQLALRVPLASGESIAPGRPQVGADGSTVIAFSKLGATNTAPAVVATAPPVVAPVPTTVVAAPTPSPTPTAPAPSAGTVVTTAPTPELKTAVEQLLPGALSFDPLARADFAIPEAPGAAVLDQTSQVMKPGSPRETVTSLLSNFDDTGKLKTGFSIGVTPYTLLRKEPVTLGEYGESARVRFFSRLQVSLAAKTGTTAENGSTSPALFGIGLSGVLFDDSDPRCDPILLAKLKNLFPKAWETTPEARAAFARGEPLVVPAVEQRKLDAFEQITAAARKAKWNAAAMGFGYAVRLKSASGKIEDARDDGGAGWLNYSRPGFGSLEDNSQFLFTASYRYHDTFTRENVTGVEDTFNFAAQLRVGTRDFNGYGQVAHHWRAPRGMSHTSDTSVEFGLERRLLDGLWLNLGWTNEKSLGGNSAIKTGLRYGFGQAASLGQVK